MDLSPKHQVHWQQLPDMPVGKWEPASLVLNDKLHVLGGYEDNIVSSRRQHLFDPADGSWTELQECPSKISHVDLVEGDTGFWFAGGMKDKPSRKPKDHIIAEVWHFDPELDRFSAAPAVARASRGQCVG